MTTDDLYIIVIVAIISPLFLLDYFLKREQRKLDEWYLKEFGKPRRIKRKTKFR